MPLARNVLLTSIDMSSSLLGAKEADSGGAEPTKDVWDKSKAAFTTYALLAAIIANRKVVLTMRQTGNAPRSTSTLARSLRTGA